MDILLKEAKPELIPLGTLIRENRERLSLSKTSLSRMVGLTDTAIGGMEAGRIRPKSDTVRKLIKAFDLPQADYVKWSELSGYEIKADQINDTVLVSDKYEEIDSKKQRYSDQDSILAIADFLASSSNRSLLTAIVEVRQEDDALYDKEIHMLVVIAKANKTRLSTQTWKSIIADLTVNYH